MNELKDGEDEADVSLLTNKIRTLHTDEENNTELNSSQLAVKPDGTVVIKDSYGAEFLGQRSWKGLERDVPIKEAELAREGKMGTAKKYENEPLWYF